jgi:uncharacterized protein
MLYLAFYEIADDMRSVASACFAEHRARLEDFYTRDLLLISGSLDDPLDGTIVGVFTSRWAAQEFIAGDPFVINGVVRLWHIRRWNVDAHSSSQLKLTETEASSEPTWLDADNNGPDEWPPYSFN